MSSENQLRNKGIENAIPPSRTTAIFNAFSHLNKMHFFHRPLHDTEFALNTIIRVKVISI